MTNISSTAGIKEHEATVMSEISFYVAILSFLASIPVVFVLRSHYYDFVCHSCCRRCRRCRRDLPADRRELTEPDIILSIILCLQSSDLVFAFGHLLTPVNDPQTICTLQGLILQLAGPLSMLFSACLSFELNIVIKSILRGESSTTNGRRRLLLYCLSSCIISIAFLIADSIDNHFGRPSNTNTKEIAWCWVRNQDDLSFASFYGVAFCVYVAVFINYALVCGQILRKVNQITHEGIRSSLWKTVRKVGLYPFLMLVTFLPGLIHRFPTVLGQPESNTVDVSARQNKTTLLYFHAATQPLLGLVDATIVASGNRHVRKKLWLCMRCQGGGGRGGGRGGVRPFCVTVSWDACVAGTTGSLTWQRY